MIFLCRHCNQRRATHPFLLCFRCYHTPGVRKLFGAKEPKKPSGGKP